MTDTTTSTTGELPRLLDIAALAEHLGVDVRHVRRLVAERRIPYIKWGHLLRFDPTEIAEWIDQNRRHPGRPRL
jgi:excisionase family DNA binding protein